MNSLAKQNYSTAAEDALNTQIQIQQTASHVYLSAAAYFARDNVALPGLQKFFQEQAHEQQEEAQFLIDYQTTRGGQSQLRMIPEPNTEWNSAVNAIGMFIILLAVARLYLLTHDKESSLSLEKDVNKASLNLTTLANDQHDPHLFHVLKKRPLKHRVQSIEELAKAVTQLQRTGGEGLGLYLIDQDIYKHGNFSLGRLGLDRSL